MAVASGIGRSREQLRAIEDGRCSAGDVDRRLGGDTSQGSGRRKDGRQASFSPSRAPRSAIPPSDALALSLVCGSDGCVVLVELLGTM
jgi:hypothetical protein